MTHFIDLDIMSTIVDGELFDDEGHRVTEGFDLKVNILTPRSSGGGWPEARITGSKHEICRYLAVKYCFDESDFEYFVERIEEI